MAQYSIQDVTPGETAELTFTVKGLDIGETVSNATIEIRSRSGNVVVPVKTITSVQTANGIIDVVASVPTLVFNFTNSETIALNTREPYYLFSVNVTTSLGRRQAIVPIGRINPSSGFPFVPTVKLGSASISISLIGIKALGAKS